MQSPPDDKRGDIVPMQCTVVDLSIKEAVEGGDTLFSAVIHLASCRGLSKKFVNFISRAGETSVVALDLDQTEMPKPISDRPSASPAAESILIVVALGQANKALNPVS